MTGRRRAARPDERTRRENLASLLQLGLPINDSDDHSAGGPTTVCLPRNQRCTVTAASESCAGQFEMRKRPGQAKIDRANKRGEREASAAMGAGTAQTGPTARAGGTQRGTQV